MTFVPLVLSMVLAADEAGRATALYAKGDFEDALRATQGALVTTTNGKERGRLHLLEARCLNALRRTKDVERSLEAALSDDAELVVDTSDSPTLVAAVQQARTRLAGRLEVDSEPKGAGVRLDGVLVGKAPVSEALPVGRHVVEIIERDGSEASRREVVMTARGQVTLLLTASIKRVTAPTDPPRLSAPAQHRTPPLVPVRLTVTARALVDVCPGCASGLGVEGGLGVLGRWFLAELSVVGGGSVGLGLRAGARVPFGERWSAQLTGDGVVFFGQSTALGVGATIAGSIAVVPWLELTAEFAVRNIFAAPTHRSIYLLPMLGVRVRFPTEPLD